MTDGIFFITGTSGAGKSTLITHLRKKLPESHYVVHDFDEVGVPEDPDAGWRLQTTDHWLKEAQKNNVLKKSTVICGVVVPTEVLRQKPDVPIYFGLIKVDDATIRSRLKNRDWAENLIEDNVKWAHHLEKEVSNCSNHIIVDGTNTPEGVARMFAQWILKKE